MRGTSCVPRVGVRHGVRTLARMWARRRAPITCVVAEAIANRLYLCLPVSHEPANESQLFTCEPGVCPRCVGSVV